MFIEKIRLMNLASLRGCWTLDFTNPQYNNGIFAITGSNGAGKSTIMDAICLALYGKTPRLNSFNSENNDIMSKGTNECRSEVTFRTAQGRFTARWSHKRTRKNAKKAFGEVSREFLEMQETTDDYRVLSSKRAEVDALVESRTGLTFPQFTQTAMLAQFQFEKFLKCDVKERTKILETLTETYGYRELVEFAKKHSEEMNGEVLMLKARMCDVKVRTSEEMKALEEEFETRKKEKEEVKKEQNHLKTEREALQRWNSLQKRIQIQHEEETRLADEEKTFTPDAHRLQRAQKARFVRDSAAKFHGKKEFLSECAASLERLESEIQTLEINLKEAETRETQQNDALKEAVILREKEEPGILKARALDTQLKDVKNRILQQEKTLHEAEKCAAEWEEKLQKARFSESETQNELNVLREKLPMKSEEEFQRFQEEYSGLNARIEAHIRHYTQLETLGKEIRDEISVQNSLQTDLLAAKEDVSREERNVGEAADVYHSASDFFSRIQDSRILEGTDAKKDENTKNHLNMLEGILNSICDSEKYLKELQQRQEEYRRKCSRVSEEAAAEESAVNHLEMEILALKETQQNMRLVKTYEDARQHLHNGSPCPLCGATSHPYAEQNPAQNSESLEAEIQSVNAEKKAHELTLKTKREEESRFQAELAADARSEKERTEELSLLQERLAAERDFFERRTVETREILYDFIEKKRLELAEKERKRDVLEVQFEDARRTLQEAEAQKKKLENVFLNAQKRLNEKMNQQIASEICISGKEKQFSDSVNEMRVKISELAEILRLFEPNYEVHSFLFSENDAEEVKNLKFTSDLTCFTTDLTSDSDSFSATSGFRTDSAADVIPDVIPCLTLERNAWLETAESLKKRYDLQCAIQKKEEKFEEKRILTEKTEMETVAARKSAAEKITELQDSTAQRNVILSERHDVFADRDPEEAEEALKITEKNARTAYETAKAASEALKNDLKHQNAALQKTLSARGTALAELQTLESEFLEVLKFQGFTDETDFTASNLPENEIQKLEETSRQLAERKNRLEGIARQNLQELESFRINAKNETEISEIQPPSTRSEPELQKLQEEAEKKFEVLTEEIVKMQYEQNEQKEALLKIGDLLKKVQEKEAQTLRWKNLFQTLGGANNSRSDAFVNYVQNITLNRLLHYANEQLLLLDPRYSLRINPADPTEIQISDACQEAAARSINTISGGETFLVSMALALGLTRMASRKVEINSFFIDEGFGSLASDKLENALSVLKTYNQNAHRRGQKLIGIISHVNSIQDEIETVISVTPFPPSNFSQISGPGVSGSSSAH